MIEKPFNEFTGILNLLDSNELVHFEDDVSHYPTIQALPTDWAGFITVNGTYVEDWWVTPNDIFHVNCTVRQLKAIIKQDFELLSVEDYELNLQQ